MNSESGRQGYFSGVIDSDRKSNTASVCGIRSQQKSLPKKKKSIHMLTEILKQEFNMNTTCRYSEQDNQLVH
jgi:hypothetical protein